MPTLRQINGRWYGIFKRKGQSASVPLGDKERPAKVRLRQLEADYLSGSWSPFAEQVSPISIADHFNLFIQKKIREGLKQRPLSLYRVAVQSFIESAEVTHHSEITPEAVQDWYNGLTVSDSTRRTYLTHLKAFLSCLSQTGAIKTDIGKSVKLVRSEKPLPDHLSREEFDRLVEVIRADIGQAGPSRGDLNYFIDIVELAPLTMMRLSELVNLEWRDLHDGMIYVRNTKGKRPRTIPITGKVEQIINRAKSRATSDRFVFSFSGSRLDPYGLSKRFRFFCDKAGIRSTIHFHSLRHSGATWFLRATGDLMTLKELLGHSQISVTQIYTHITGADKVNRMEQYLKTLAG